MNCGIDLREKLLTVVYNRGGWKKRGLKFGESNQKMKNLIEWRLDIRYQNNNRKKTFQR